MSPSSQNTTPKTFPCPHCGKEQVPVYIDTPRHGRHVCDTCESRATDSAGRRVYGNNVSMSGGFVACFRRHDDDARQAAPETCDEVTQSNVCFIDGAPCYINERRFGGTYISPMTLKLTDIRADVDEAESEAQRGYAQERLLKVEQATEQAVRRYAEQQQQQQQQHLQFHPASDAQPPQ